MRRSGQNGSDNACVTGVAQALAAVQGQAGQELAYAEEGPVHADVVVLAMLQVAEPLRPDDASILIWEPGGDDIAPATAHPGLAYLALHLDPVAVLAEGGADGELSRVNVLEHRVAVIAKIRTGLNLLHIAGAAVAAGERLE
jgi:hypothetical protein